MLYGPYPYPDRKPEIELMLTIRPHRCRLDFAEEQFSITPGQAAVFYAGDTVLGGGLIQR